MVIISQGYGLYNQKAASAHGSFVSLHCRESRCLNCSHAFLSFGLVVVVAQEMQHSVSDEKRQFLLQRMTLLPGLPVSLLIRDDDLAEVENAVWRHDEMLFLASLRFREDEGEHVRCPVDSPVVAVEVMDGLIASYDEADVHRPAYAGSRERGLHCLTQPGPGDEAAKRLLHPDAEVTVRHSTCPAQIIAGEGQQGQAWLLVEFG